MQGLYSPHRESTKCLHNQTLFYVVGRSLTDNSINTLLVLDTMVRVCTKTVAFNVLKCFMNATITQLAHVAHCELYHVTILVYTLHSTVVLQQFHLFARSSSH